MSYNVVVQYKLVPGLPYAKSTTCSTVAAVNARLSEIGKEKNVVNVEVYDDDTNEKVPLVDGKLVDIWISSAAQR